MKSLIRRNLTHLLATSSFVLSLFASNVPAFALPEQQIIQKLHEVPVWMITDAQGLPLTYKLANGGSLTGVFMSKAEAQAFIKKLQALKNPNVKVVQLFKSLQAIAAPLSFIYKQSLPTENQAPRLRFAFIPADQEIKGARVLLRASGQDVKQVRTVPVFMVRFAPNKGYVPQLRSDKKEYFPLFMSNQDAKALLNRVKPKFPKAYIQVADVNDVLTAMQDRNDKWVQQAAFIPSTEARAFIQAFNQAVSQNPKISQSLMQLLSNIQAFNQSTSQNPENSQSLTQSLSKIESITNQIDVINKYNSLYNSTLLLNSGFDRVIHGK